MTRTTTHPVELPAAIVEATRSVCAGLPETHEEPAWVGVRWRIRSHTFAHLVPLEAGWPPAYARAAGSEGPLTVLTFRTPEPDAYRHGRAGHPFFWPGWFADLVGMIIEPDADWAAIGELLIDSYCTRAPKRLVTKLNTTP